MWGVFSRTAGLFQPHWRWSLGMAIAFSAAMGGCSGSDHLVVTAHRGASSVAPENTLSAMVAAVEAGAEFAELDVGLSRDGEVVLMHDRTLDRTTNGTGNLGEHSLEELRGLEAGGWFSQEFTGEPIPTLREIIHFARGKLKLNIEIKNSRDEPTIAASVVDIIRSEDFVKECMVTSFSRETVEEVKRIAPEIMTGFIFGEDYPDDVFQGGWEVLSSNHKVVDSTFVAQAKAGGKRVHVWTVDDRDLMLRLIGLGVDGIISNRPALLLEVLAEEL
jgi:glycerophosphoryl diester phosphodiesterase